MIKITNSFTKNTTLPINHVQQTETAARLSCLDVTKTLCVS